MNMLANETSPYLRQHAGNPVHWRPWSQETLTVARQTGKPILLSIGYAACHWCHVMAHESFEDPLTAALMNELYINIKVDREERPDIDQIYMAALNATGEQGGWPLTMFLTPDARPFWGGTYFPPRPAHGRPSFQDVLRAVNKAWREQRPHILNSAGALSQHVSERLASTAGAREATAGPLNQLTAQISNLIDPELGGLRGAPKFPNAPFMQALWITGLNTSNPSLIDQVTDSLSKMLHGGIYDHIGGGLCRYSTDAEWIVPHFEKMLYDNAQLVSLTRLAFARTGDPLFAEAIEGTLTWIDRELTVESGGFASSLDADSDGEEGLFYTWTPEQITEVLGVNEANRLQNTYQLIHPVNWEGAPIVTKANHSASESNSAIQKLLVRLRTAREQRIRPARDDKVLTDWNGFAIRAFAEAGRQFARSDWLERAKTAFRSITESESPEGRLPHSSLGAHRLYPALSSDYASVINAAVALFEETSDADYLKTARRYADQLERWHTDGQGSHYLTASDATDVPMRIRGDTDDPVPSATAQIIDALTRLSSATSDTDIYLRAKRAAELALGRADGQVYGQAGIFTAGALVENPIKLVLAEAPKGALRRSAAHNPDPRRVDVIATQPNQLPVGFDFAAAPAAWLCTGAVCLASVHTENELKALLIA
jgi:uncharacterized protein YyaL (SSP411 family)